MPAATLERNVKVENPAMLVGLVERLAVPGRPLPAPFSDKLVG